MWLGPGTPKNTLRMDLKHLALVKENGPNNISKARRLPIRTRGAGWGGAGRKNALSGLNGPNGPLRPKYA